MATTAAHPLAALRPTHADARRARLVVGTSLLCCLGWLVLRTSPHAFGGLSGGLYSDHVSHMNAARGLTVVGANLWRRPLRDRLAHHATERPTTARDLPSAGPTGSTFVVPGWPLEKPWLTNWTALPRP